MVLIKTFLCENVLRSRVVAMFCLEDENSSAISKMVRRPVAGDFTSGFRPGNGGLVEVSPLTGCRRSGVNILSRLRTGLRSHPKSVGEKAKPPLDSQKFARDLVHSPDSVGFNPAPLPGRSSGVRVPTMESAAYPSCSAE